MIWPIRASWLDSSFQKQNLALSCLVKYWLSVILNLLKQTWQGLTGHFLHICIQYGRSTYFQWPNERGWDYILCIIVSLLALWHAWLVVPTLGRERSPPGQHMLHQLRSWGNLLQLLHCMQFLLLMEDHRPMRQPLAMRRPGMRSQSTVVPELILHFLTFSSSSRTRREFPRPWSSNGEGGLVATLMTEKLDAIEKSIVHTFYLENHAQSPIKRVLSSYPTTTYLFTPAVTHCSHLYDIPVTTYSGFTLTAHFPFIWRYFRYYSSIMDIEAPWIEWAIYWYTKPFKAWPHGYHCRLSLR